MVSNSALASGLLDSSRSGAVGKGAAGVRFHGGCRVSVIVVFPRRDDTPFLVKLDDAPVVCATDGREFDVKRT